MEKNENQRGFLHALYVRRYLILASCVLALVVVMFNVRPKPDAKVRFVTSVAYGDGFQPAVYTARCEVLEVYDREDFANIAAYKEMNAGKVKDFYVSKGTYLNKGEVYYIRKPDNRRTAIFYDESWDWEYMTKVFLISAFLWYVALVAVLVILGLAGVISKEENPG